MMRLADVAVAVVLKAPCCNNQARERQQLALLYNINVVGLTTLKIAIVLLYALLQRTKKEANKKSGEIFSHFAPCGTCGKLHLCTYVYTFFALGCVLWQLQIMFTRLCVAATQLPLAAFGLLVLRAVDFFIAAILLQFGVGGYDFVVIILSIQQCRCTQSLHCSHK